MLLVNNSKCSKQSRDQPSTRRLRDYLAQFLMVLRIRVQVLAKIVSRKIVFDANGADVVGKTAMVQCFVIKLAQCFRSRRGIYTKSCSKHKY